MRDMGKNLMFKMLLSTIKQNVVVIFVSEIKGTVLLPEGAL